MVDVEAIIEYLYRMTYTVCWFFFKLIYLVVFLKWEHIGFKIDIFSGVFEMYICGLLLTLGKRYIVKQGTLDYFCLPGRLRCFVNRRVKQ